VTAPRPRPRWRLGALGLLAAAILALAAGPAPAGAATGPKVTGEEAVRAADAEPRLRGWIEDHPVVRTTPEFDPDEEGYVVYYVAEEDGEEFVEAQVIVDDATGEVVEVRTGPQVAWSMARGYEGAFGRAINRPAVWLTLCALFLLPLLRWRRLWSVRTLDLLVMLLFSVSLVWFNRGEIFTSVPLAYPPLAYLGARLAWIGLRAPRRQAAAPDAPDGVGPPGASEARPGFAGACPTWLLVSALALALALRYGLNAFDSNVIDVGYAGVIGADRILEGETPYGNMPSDCASCDTYGPLNYIAYTPFVAALGWSGEWDSLPAAHGAATMFDAAALLGMATLGWQLAGLRLAALLALAWAAFPFTGYALASNANDGLIAALLAWGLVLARRPAWRGAMLGLAVLAKFAPAVLAALWARGPRAGIGARGARGRDLAAYAGGLAAAGALTAWVLALDGADGITGFWSRTVAYQAGRDSPFSVWGQHPALRPLQLALVAAVGLAALALALRPRRPLGMRAFAGLGGAVLIGVQLVQTHWFYLYIPWFMPFALLALVPEWRAAAPSAPAGPPAAREAGAAQAREPELAAGVGAR
jgi:Glycosyltransferase family 87